MLIYVSLEKLLKEQGKTKSCGCLLRESKYIIAPGTRFGMLTVISLDGNYALCRCDCGNVKRIYKYPLIKGDTYSCGCLPTEKKPVPLASGLRFGKLTVISSTGSMSLCRCDCGNKITVQKYLLVSGHTKSCGCLPVPIAPGTRFGKLTVISSDRSKILCRCDFVNEKTVRRACLINGHTKSCGCLPRGRKPAHG